MSNRSFGGGGRGGAGGFGRGGVGGDGGASRGGSGGFSGSSHRGPVGPAPTVPSSPNVPVSPANSRPAAPSQPLTREGQGGSERGLVHAPGPKDALRISPNEPGPGARLGIDQDPGAVLTRSPVPELAAGPPWVVGYLLYDGRHPALVEYFRHNRRILGKAAGEEVLLVGVGHPRHFDEAFEQMGGDKFIDAYKSMMAPIYEQLVNEFGQEKDVAIDGTEKLAELLGVSYEQLPCIRFLSHPRTMEDVGIGLPLTLVDSVDKHRQVTEVLVPELGRLRKAGLFEEGMSNEAVMKKLRSWASDVETRLRVRAPDEQASQEDGWRYYPTIGDLKYHGGHRLLCARGTEYRVGSDARDRVIQYLLRMQNSRPGPIQHRELMAAAGSPGRKIQDVFKNHPILTDGVLVARTRGLWALEA